MSHSAYKRSKEDSATSETGREGPFRKSKIITPFRWGPGHPTLHRELLGTADGAFKKGSVPKMMKNDEEKLRWDLLPYEAIEEIVRILTYGTKKYKENNWKLGSKKEDKDRVFAAMMRHIVAYKKGAEIDEESGFMHLSHAACNLIFLIYHELTHKELERNWD